MKGLIGQIDKKIDALSRKINDWKQNIIIRNKSIDKKE
jgi:hypothetical protein